MQYLVILFLISLNGLLSMIEFAFVSVPKTRLQKLAQDGNDFAVRALKIKENPNRFLSTIQVGITLIGIITGAIGGLELSLPAAQYLSNTGMSASLAEPLSFIFIVILITYLSLVFGELIPKRLGLNFSEKIILIFVSPMHKLSLIFYPVVTVLSKSTEFFLSLFQIKANKRQIINEDDVRILINETARLGIFDPAEKNIVEKVLDIKDTTVKSLMTTGNKVIWLDVNESIENINEIIKKYEYSYFPVCEGELDKIVGVIRTDSYLSASIGENKPKNIKPFMLKPLLIPENKKLLAALELFKRKRIHLGIIIDEYGNVEGIISLTDILEAIVGDIPDTNDLQTNQIIKRDTNSWFVDGLLSTSDFRDFFKIKNLGEGEDDDYHTIGGFVMDFLGRLPRVGDKILLAQYSIEVVDMDGNRVDKIMVRKT